MSGEVPFSGNELAGTSPEKPQFPTKIVKSDLRPHPIQADETEIVLQRHGAYIRNPEDPNRGSLGPESAAAEKASAKSYFESVLSQVTEEERSKTDLLFVASDTSYHGGGQRSYETASLAEQAAAEVLDQFGLDRTQILNSSHHLRGEPGPKPMGALREPQMFNESPEFVQFLIDRYGDKGLEFWKAFEEDKERDARLAMGAEGPDEIADRLAHSVNTLARYARLYHEATPGRRLII